MFLKKLLYTLGLMLWQLFVLAFWSSIFIGAMIGCTYLVHTIGFSTVGSVVLWIVNVLLWGGMVALWFSFSWDKASQRLDK